MHFTYWDIHSHVQGKEYEEDRDELLAALAAQGVGTIAVGVHEESSRAASALAHTHKNVFAAVGQHPTDTREHFDAKSFSLLAAEPRVVAIGECGLDYFRTDDITAARRRQTPLFEAHIDLAARTRKPLMVHARPSRGTYDAYHEIIDILRSAKRTYGDALTGNIHFFVGGVDEARAFFDLNFTVSFTAVITFARDYDDAIRFAPRDRILTETDSPYMAPAARRGQRNDPWAVQDVMREIALIRGEEEETVRRATVANAQRVFHIDATRTASP